MLMSRENHLPEEVMEELQAGEKSSSDQPAPSAVGKRCIPKENKDKREEVPNSHDIHLNCKVSSAHLIMQL